MKKAVVSLLAVVALSMSTSIFAEDDVAVPLIAQNSESQPVDASDNKEAAPAPLSEKKAPEKSLPEESLKARKEALNNVRNNSEDVTEYTLDPSSVELLVELDPNNYGFRTRNHRMSISADVDFVLRGRAMLRYDYRFFRYFSFGPLLGIDASDLSLFARFRDQLSKPSPWQLSILGGAFGKWRLTEWYMRSAFFLEPSLLVGHMWQTLPTQSSTHWRVRPGVFLGVETVFDSGFSMNTRVGAEFPFDFGALNPMREVVEPLFVFSFGLAI